MPQTTSIRVKFARTRQIVQYEPATAEAEFEVAFSEGESAEGAAESALAAAKAVVEDALGITPAAKKSPAKKAPAKKAEKPKKEEKPAPAPEPEPEPELEKKRAITDSPEDRPEAPDEDDWEETVNIDPLGKPELNAKVKELITGGKCKGADVNAVLSEIFPGKTSAVLSDSERGVLWSAVSKKFNS